MIVKFNTFLNESNSLELDKEMIKNAFPEYQNPEFLGKGQFGASYIVEKNNEFYVAKITKSLPEYWFSQIVKEYPHEYINKV